MFEPRTILRRLVLLAFAALVATARLNAGGRAADESVEGGLAGTGNADMVPASAPVMVAALDRSVPGRGAKGDRVRDPQWRGEFGGDLELLRSFYTPPSGNGESNHYFDLWEPGSLATFARTQGLTNNRTLFVDSHGTERFSWKGLQYVLRPNVAAVGEGRKVPTYAVADLARILGPEAAGRVHNIVIAGCNEGGSLVASALRRHFPAATNVIYMAAGNLSYKPQFYQILTLHSADIEPLYGREVTSANGRVKAEIFRRPVDGARPLGRYVAELFEPGAPRAYRRQMAGRELLEPGFRRAAELRAEADPAWGEP